MSVPSSTDKRMAMVRDIEQEVAWTQGAIGKDRLDARVMAAMAKVPRECFVPESYRFRAFDNAPVPIGYGQTISQPYIVALMADLIAPQPNGVILEVGTGSGYQAAVLADLVEHVYSVEIVAALANAAAQKLKEMSCENVTIKHGDGWYGWPDHAPYDGIIVAASAPTIPPSLIEQLKPGARLVMPLRESYGQDLTVIEKRNDGVLDMRRVMLVAFVPLTRFSR